jgi:excisionase family DNA binding protein
MNAAATRTRPWLTIHEASDLLGVSPATVRRWTETGDLRAFVTPGGHRRFDRRSVLEMLPARSKQPRSLRDLGETPEHVVRAYRRELAATRALGDWVSSLDDSTDRAMFREPGRRMLVGILGALDAASTEDSERSMADAVAAATRHGSLARAGGLGVSTLIDGFHRFRLPFLDELARIANRRHLASDEAMDLLLAASRLFDRLLLATVDGHGATSSEGKS